jgi:Tfp pilus assembly protein PilO
MNLSRKRPQAVATIVLCAVAIALAIGVIAQQLAASRLTREIDGQKQLIQKSKQDLKDRAKFRGEYGDLSLRLGGRMSTCTWSDQMPYMVAQVTGIVGANGVKVASLQPEPMTSLGSIQRFPLRIALETDLRHITEVLRDLKSAVPLLDIERLDIRNSQSGSGKLQINMTVASFVVLDKNSPVARRRAVVPAKKTEGIAAGPEARETEKPEAAKPQSKASDTPGARPAARPVSGRPEAGSNAGSVAKPDRPERARPEVTGSARPERPAKAKNGESDRGEVQTGGDAAGPPAGLDAEAMRIRRVPKEANGGAK